MHAYLDVPTFFSTISLVDLSPSLCDVARKRFERLGWDVKVLCEDARNFRLEDHTRTANRDMMGSRSRNTDVEAKVDLLCHTVSA